MVPALTCIWENDVNDITMNSSNCVKGRIVQNIKRRRLHWEDHVRVKADVRMIRSDIA